MPTTLVMPDNLQENLYCRLKSKGSSMLAALAECVKLNETKYKSSSRPWRVQNAVKEHL